MIDLVVPMTMAMIRKCWTFGFPMLMAVVKPHSSTREMTPQLTKPLCKRQRFYTCKQKLMSNHSSKMRERNKLREEKLDQQTNLVKD